MRDLEFIKRFAKITITGICKDLKINASNLYNGKTSKENENLVRKEIENRISNLYKGD